MTQAATQLSIGATERLPAPPGWLSSAEAARLLGLTDRRIRQMCAGGELPAVQGADGAWLVDPDGHPTLRIAAGHVDAPVAAASSLAGVSSAKRQAMLARLALVQEYERALPHKPATMSTGEFTAHWLQLHDLRGGERIAVSTLYNWRDRLRRHGVAGLIDRRRYAGPSDISDDAWRLFCGLWLRQANPHIPRLYEIVAAQAAVEGWSWPSLRTIQRRVHRDLDPKVVAAGRNPKKFRDRCLPYANRDWSQVPAMGLWIADHRQFDVLLPRHVWNPAKRRMEWRWYRPWLTAFLDGRSWMPAAWSIRFESPDGDLVMATFVRGVKQHGTPEHVYLDNGKDFRMVRFSGGRRRAAAAGETIVAEHTVKPLLEALGVGATFAQPYNAKTKPIEPWFRLVAEWFDKTWPTYCGRNSASRPEQLRGLATKAADWHAKGYTFEAFCAAFGRWITADYAMRESPAQAAVSPDGEALSAGRAFVELRRAGFRVCRPSDAAMALLLMPSKPVVVTANGIYVRAFGREYWHESLIDRAAASGRDLRRKVVYRFDPMDAAGIYVFDARTDVFICYAVPRDGDGVHPLLATEPDEAKRDEQADKLAATMAMRRHLARSYTAEVREARTYANELLGASRQSAEALGLLDNSPLPASPPPVIRLSGELDRAAQTAAREREISRQRRAARDEMERFYGGRLDEAAATGTDDASPCGPRAGAGEVIDLLPDGSDGGQGRPQETPHEADR